MGEVMEDLKLLEPQNSSRPPIALNGTVCTLLFGSLFVVMLNNNILEKLRTLYISLETWHIAHNT